MTKRKAELTFKHNLKRGRHGWLRLTPAYSIKVVQQILDEHPEVTYVLDPFSGTGTTGLVCGEHGIRCDLLDINPFLVWFATAKTAKYELKDLYTAQTEAKEIVKCVSDVGKIGNLWFPPISNISRWWTESRLIALAKIYHELNQQCLDNSPIKDLLLVAFCQLVIKCSNAAFNHQSMSFKDESQVQQVNDEDQQFIFDQFLEIVSNVVKSAKETITGKVEVIEVDARNVPRSGEGLYDCVITSPPYPNRMSYIRELRPYMYWLGYLKEAREAGELDWKSIGGTWGIATSRVGKWEPNGAYIAYPEFEIFIANIAERSKVLANYVHKYFIDISTHLETLYNSLAPGAKVFYIIGNSKYYDTLVPVERIYAWLLEQKGFADINTEMLRKRNSKKELYEFVVSGVKP